MEDRQTIATLTETNAKLVQKLNEANDKLVKALEKLAQSDKTNYSRGEKGPHYCWSCGSKVYHPSRKCINRKDGHKDEASNQDKMGGLTFINGF